MSNKEDILSKFRKNIIKKYDMPRLDDIKGITYPDPLVQFISMTENGISAEQACQYLNNYSTVFAWMPELVTALGDYANNRNKYRSISDFYPQLAKVLNKYLDDEQKRLDKALK